MTKTIIFDFDGTIADSFDVFVETLEDVLNRPPFTDDEIKSLRGLSISRILSHLGIKKWQIPKLIATGRRNSVIKMNRVKIFEGMGDVLKELSLRGYRLYILSSNSNGVISTFLENNGIGQYVTDIYGDVGLFGKKRELIKLCRDNGYKKSDCVYVGDEVRDVQAAHKAGVQCVSVSWGYNNPQSLKPYNPKGIVSSPQDLLERFL